MSHRFTETKAVIGSKTLLFKLVNLLLCYQAHHARILSGKGHRLDGKFHNIASFFFAIFFADAAHFSFYKSISRQAFDGVYR
ncbi:MAG: hypothetical protein QNJ55_10500 [Xenococcus sp. MO_188.B8]|nr:hypothetical protein [Xenococcus sp. MO_188.B8]